MTRNYCPKWTRRIKAEFWDPDVGVDALAWNTCAIGEALRLDDFAGKYPQDDIDGALGEVSERLCDAGLDFYDQTVLGHGGDAEEALANISRIVQEEGGRRKLRAELRQELKRRQDAERGD